MEQIKLDSISKALVVEKEPSIAANGAKFKKVTLNGGIVGYLFSNIMGTDEKGNDIFSEYTGDIKIFRTTPLELGKVKVLGKTYTLVEKELKKDDGTKYTVKVLTNDDGVEVGRYSKAYKKIGKRTEFYRNRWMVRFNAYID